MPTTRAPVLPSGSNRFSRSWLLGAVAPRIYYYFIFCAFISSTHCIQEKFTCTGSARLRMRYVGMNCIAFAISCSCHAPRRMKAKVNLSKTIRKWLGIRQAYLLVYRAYCIIVTRSVTFCTKYLISSSTIDQYFTT